MEFDKKFLSITTLINAEDQVSSTIVKDYKGWVHNWEQGYYILSKLISNTSISPSFTLPAALISESHSSIRTAFLVLLKGYFPEAMTLLRRAHETTVKAMYVSYCYKNKVVVSSVKILNQTNPEAFESKMGFSLKKTYQIESAFAHSDMLQSFRAINRKNLKDLDIPYGPQTHDLISRVAVNLSIFWILVNLLIFTKTFPGMLKFKFEKEYTDTINLLEDYLRNIKKQVLFKDYIKLKASLKT